MSFDVEKLEHLAGEGWLRRQRHPEADLWIYNYTEKTQYEKHWTAETLACRGLILDADGRIVARPFPKFFNLGDPLVGELPQEPFTVTEKVDGSLGIVYVLDGVCKVATRGSFTSEQAKTAMEMLKEYELGVSPGQTPLLEIVYPENRIVVDYSGSRELVLLAVIENDTGEEGGIYWSGPAVEQHEFCDLDEVVAQQRPNREGFVVTFESGLRVKIKHADYVRLHRIITGVNARHIWEALRAGQDPTTELDGVPDEIYDWIRGTVGWLREDYAAQEGGAIAAFDSRPVTEDRKEIAGYFKSFDNPAVLFRMLDSKPYEDLIWKAIRPEPTTPDTVWNQEIAA